MNSGGDFLSGDFDGVEAEDDFAFQQIRAGDHGAVEKPLVGGDPAGFALVRESRPAVEGEGNRDAQGFALDAGDAEGAAQFLEGVVSGDGEVQLVGG